MTFLKNLKQIWLQAWREAQGGTSFAGTAGFEGDLGVRLIRGSKPKWYQRKEVTRHV